jgi:hypothetical protein
MRRLAAITVFALSLAVPLWAQHGGGGHAGGGFGGGGHAGGGGFSGGHAAGFSGHAGFGGSRFSGAGPSVHAYSGPRSQAMPRSYTSRGFSSVPGARFSTRPASRPFLHDDFRNTRVTIGVGGLGFRNGFRNFAFRNFRNCIGIPCRLGFGSPWWYAGYWDPWWWWDQDYNYDQDYQQNLAQAQQMNEDSLEEQQMRRQEQADGDQDAYARQPARPYAEPNNDKPGAAIIPSTVLVFRDQHKQEVENYAIVGNALWAFAPQHTQRIPLSELDLTATAEANDDRGVSFRIPHPGQ